MLKIFTVLIALNFYYATTPDSFIDVSAYNCEYESINESADTKQEPESVYIKFEKKGLWGYMYGGKTVAKAQFSEAEEPSSTSDGLFIVANKAGLYGVYDCNSKRYVIPARYKSIERGKPVDGVTRYLCDLRTGSEYFDRVHEYIYEKSEMKKNWLEYTKVIPIWSSTLLLAQSASTSDNWMIIDRETFRVMYDRHYTNLSGVLISLGYNFLLIKSEILHIGVASGRVDNLSEELNIDDRANITKLYGDDFLIDYNPYNSQYLDDQVHVIYNAVTGGIYELEKYYSRDDNNYYVVYKKLPAIMSSNGRGFISIERPNPGNETRYSLFQKYLPIETNLAYPTYKRAERFQNVNREYELEQNGNIVTMNVFLSTPGKEIQLARYKNVGYLILDGEFSAGKGILSTDIDGKTRTTNELYQFTKDWNGNYIISCRFNGDVISSQEVIYDRPRYQWFGDAIGGGLVPINSGRTVIREYSHYDAFIVINPVSRKQEKVIMLDGVGGMRTTMNYLYHSSSVKSRYCDGLLDYEAITIFKKDYEALCKIEPGVNEEILDFEEVGDYFVYCGTTRARGYINYNNAFVRVLDLKTQKEYDIEMPRNKDVFAKSISPMSRSTIRLGLSNNTYIDIDLSKKKIE